MPDLGLRYQPGAQPMQTMRMGGQPQGGTDVQSPAKILSLRVPKGPLGPSALAPRALLTAQGSAGAGSNGLNALIQALMRAYTPQATPQGTLGATDAAGGWGNIGGVIGANPAPPPTPPTPAPHFTPGQTEDRAPAPPPDAPLYTPNPYLLNKAGFGPGQFQQEQGTYSNWLADENAMNGRSPIRGLFD